MANDARVPGKRGANPRDPQRYVPYAEHYLKPWEGPVSLKQAMAGPVIPPVPPGETIDRESAVPDWPIYLNDRLGDCTIAEKAHKFAAMCVYAGYPEPAFSDAVIQSAYSLYSGYVPGDPSTDNGCDDATVLQGMVKNGLADTTGKVHKIAAWAAFKDPTNLALLTAVLNTFGSVTVDIYCPQSAEDQFASGSVWQYVPGSPVLGGHSIAFQKRGAGYTGVQEFVTWGTTQRATRRFCHHLIFDAYLAVSEDWITANGTTVQGFDLEQLLADMPGVE